MKGMSKKQNEITWQHFKSTLEGSKDMARNRSFCMKYRRMVTYEQQTLGLSAHNDKRWVLLRRANRCPWFCSNSFFFDS